MEITSNDLFNLLVNTVNLSINTHEHETYNTYIISFNEMILNNKIIVDYLKNTHQINKKIRTPASTYMHIYLIERKVDESWELAIVDELRPSLPERHLYKTSDINVIYKLMQFISDCKFEIQN